MQELLSRVVELQKEFSAANSAAMRERGLLVRHSLPAEIRTELSALELSLDVEGRDGTGQKSRVPWVRVFDRSRSPSARDGWYVVLLFHESGDGVTLSLNQAATEFVDNAFVPLNETLLGARVQWAREHLRDAIRSPRLAEQIELGTGSLARAYERGHVIGYTYLAPLPPDDVIREDLGTLVELLATLYRIEPLTPPPGAVDPEIRALRDEISAAAGKRTPAGAPRRLSAEERKVIENHAMMMTRAKLESMGWSVEDTHLHHSYDFVATNGVARMFVEVKGTTGDGNAVILTRNEVAHHRANSSESCLAVVRNIIIILGEDEVTSTGGVVDLWIPMVLTEDLLSPLAFEYQVPREGTVVRAREVANARRLDVNADNRAN